MRCFALFLTWFFALKLCSTTLLIEAPAYAYELRVTIQGNPARVLSGKAERLGEISCGGIYNFDPMANRLSITFANTDNDDCASHSFEASMSITNVVDMMNAATVVTTLRSHILDNQPVHATIKLAEENLR